jgi:putative transposase
VVAGVLFHTDQGSEYTGNLFVEACGSAGVTQSMGPPARPSTTPSPRHSTQPSSLSCCADATSPPVSSRRAVATWIDEYNTDRRHSTKSMLSPVDYERTNATKPDTAPATINPHGGRAA